MASPARRQYRSTLRAAQARQTRQTIVSAASELFTRDGFGATTIDAIAEEAGVSRKTVFTAAGGKIELLKLALDWAIAGDDEPVAVADRPEVGAATGPGSERVLRGSARCLPRSTRELALVQAMELAATADPAARSLFEDVQGQRRNASRDVVHRVVDLNALKSGLTAEEATDLAWLFSDPALYNRLVRSRGWSPERFADWLGEAMCRELLA